MRLPWRKRSDEIDEELRQHLRMAIAERVQRGEDPQAAEWAARREFGNVTHIAELTREVRGGVWFERLVADLRYALRAMRHRPGFSVAAIVTLALGIGFNTAIFTTFYALGFRMLPVRDADRIVNVHQRFHGEYTRGVHGVQSMVSYPEYQAYQTAIESARGGGGALASAAVYGGADFAFDRSPRGTLHGQYVSCNYFQLLGVRLALGRGFVADECRHVGVPPAAVLSHAVWMRELGGDSSFIGRTVRLNGVPMTVIGVAEPNFGGLSVIAAGAWVPITMQLMLSHGGDSLLVRDWSWLSMVARLAPHGSITAARAQLALIARRRDGLYPGRTTEVVVSKGAFLTFPEARAKGGLGVALLAVLGALVVAMVCANIMNLQLARGIARRREIGIRLAIGASRTRLIEQLLAEGAMLALAGGALGLMLALVLPPLLPRLIPLQLQLDLSPDFTVLLFTFALSILTAVLFGMVPAFQATSVDLMSAFKGGMIAGRRQFLASRLRNFVVGVQVAGSALLLVVAALFIRAAQKGANAHPGYNTDRVVSFGLNTTQLGYDASRTRSTYDALADRLATAPNVESFALVSPLPLLGRRVSSVRPINQGAEADEVRDVGIASVSSAYLATMEIPLVAGRAFTSAEMSPGGERPVVLSHSLARRLWPSQHPLGKRLRVGDGQFVVVGVAADTRVFSLGDATTPFVYLPGQPDRDTRLRFVVRVRGSMSELEALMPRWARELDPELVVNHERLADRVALALAPTRIASAVGGALGMLATLLALVGIYGVVSYAVSQRTRDIAVRLALGSTPRGVVRLMMRQGSHSVMAGLIVGVTAAAAASRVIRGFLLGVSPLDPAAYVAVAAVLFATSLAATYAPARRAARVDPAGILRAE